MAALGITVSATVALLPALGIVAIPIGFAIGMAGKVVLLGLALAVRLRGFGGPVPGA